MKRKNPAIYIMSNQKNGAVYTGVTSNIIKRVYEHKNSIMPGFASEKKCTLLVYYEFFDSMIAAIDREKQIKAGSRKKKLQLIEELNPMWDDLYLTLV
jgi:putative endonuclease